MVMDNIIEEYKLPGEQLVCFGDGPVELREVKKKGGMPVGIASDEVRRFGFNNAKLERLIKAGADIIMLDNMSLETMRQAVKVINGRAKIEASGNITLNNVRAIVESGVDFISIGALTHSVKAFDFSLEMSPV